MDFVEFRWISCNSDGFDAECVTRSMESGPKHFDNVLEVITTRLECPTVLILSRNWVNFTDLS